MSVLLIPDFVKLASRRGNSCLHDKRDLIKQIPRIPPAEEWDDMVYRADLEACVGGMLECAILAARLVEGTRYSDATDGDDVKAALRLHRRHNSEYFYEEECPGEYWGENLEECLCCPILTDLYFQLKAVDPQGAYSYAEDVASRAFGE